MDPCKVCSFKTLQSVEECQETGYRMILRCQTTLASDKTDIREETFMDVSCTEAATEFSSLEDGLYAKYNSGPTSVYWFFISMASMAYIVYKLLDARRQAIINEVYAKTTIIKTMN